VLFDNYVAQVDADAKSDLPIVGDLPLAASHPPQHLCGTTHRIDDASELGKQAVAGVLHHAAPMLLDRWMGQLGEMRLDPIVSALLIRTHQPRVARHIGGEDRGQTAG
jgi:hypothetical protein